MQRRGHWECIAASPLCAASWQINTHDRRILVGKFSPGSHASQLDFVPISDEYNSQSQSWKSRTWLRRFCLFCRRSLLLLFILFFSLRSPSFLTTHALLHYSSLATLATLAQTIVSTLHQDSLQLNQTYLLRLLSKLILLPISWIQRPINSTFSPNKWLLISPKRRLAP